MAQVANEVELETALNNGESLIELTASFPITAYHSVTSTTTITSSGEPYTLTKAADYGQYIFQITLGGALTLTNIILDGNKEAHTTTQSNFALITVLQGSLTLDNGTILQNNLANEGAGVFVDSNSTNSLIMRGTAIIRNNDATQNGGAILANNVPVTIADDARIEQNTSKTRGGGIYFDSTTQSSLSIRDRVVITGNKGSSGGGIHIQGGAIDLSDEVVISNNNANLGASIKFQGSGLTISENVTIRDNVAQIQGGGIHIAPYSESNIAIHAKLINNTSDSGAGIAISADISTQTIDFTNAQFLNNTSRRTHGGGLLLIGTGASDQDMTILLNDTVFDQNVTPNNGAAILISFTAVRTVNIQCANMTLTSNVSRVGNGSFYLNKQGITNLTMEQCTFHKNTAVNGGALYVEPRDNSQFTITSLNDTFTENTAINNGGAICFTKGAINAQFDHVIMNDNLSANDGGAIVITESSGDITFDENSELRGNSAQHGGGIYVSGTSQVSFLNSTTTSNTASAYGTGIVANSTLSLGGDLHILDGLYLPSENAIPTLTQNLTSTSLIQLESTPYIVSNPEGTPILLASAEIPLLYTDANAFRIPASGFVGWTSQLDDPSHIVLTPIIYSIRYENTMGLTNPNPISYTVVSDTITLLPIASSIYLFYGWFDAAQGGNKISKIPQGSTEDITLYARLEPIPPLYFLVNYDANIVDNITQCLPLNQEILENGTFIISSLIPMHQDTTFLHWNTAPNDTGTIYQSSDTTQPITTNLTLYAIWKTS